MSDNSRADAPQYAAVKQGLRNMKREKDGGCAPDSEFLQTSSNLRLQCKTDPHLSGFVAICQGDKT